MITLDAAAAERRIRADERWRIITEIQRICRRNTNTAIGDATVWNKAVATMADECVDAITNLED